MKITIIGTGYVELVSGACFADVGNTVLCLDLDEGKINMLKSGGIPIHEPGLDAIVTRNHAAGRLLFSTSYDDMREAPSLVLIRELISAGCRVKAYDPVARSEAMRLLTQEHGASTCEEYVKICESPWEAVDGANALALVTEWQEFRSPDFERLAATPVGQSDIRWPQSL
jgi:UDP-glucose 6-dehydrogenase